MKKLFLLVAAAVGVTMAMAQDPADLAATPAVQETQNVEVDIMSFPENVLIESMTNSLAKQGKGYCIMHGEEIAAWAFSAAVSSEEIDIGIETVESHRQKGLAVIIAAKMVEYTISQGKNPVWACYYKNMASQRIAEKLGYIKTGECNIIKAL